MSRGFFWFVGRRSVPIRTAIALAGVGMLLGAQGVVGWIMVASGLQPGMTAVAPLKLTLHLTLAALFFTALIALFVRLGGAIREPASGARRFASRALVVLVLLQIALGGLVAGRDAGLIYNTWPLMDGGIVPSGLWMLKPLWLNVFDNLTAIQFNHRLGAYVLSAAILAYAFGMLRRGERAGARARRTDGGAGRGAGRGRDHHADPGGADAARARASGDRDDPAFRRSSWNASVFTRRAG